MGFDLSATRDGEQPQLPVARFAVEELQHRGRVGAGQPVRFGHGGGSRSRWNGFVRSVYNPTSQPVLSRG
jgi:hypothetical protein